MIVQISTNIDAIILNINVLNSSFKGKYYTRLNKENLNYVCWTYRRYF